jgi:hypothetical protein
VESYIPGYTMETRDLDNQPELTSLVMPSTLSALARARLNGPLLHCEVQLRQAAAQESLTELLNQLQSRQLFKSYRQSNARGTRATIAVAESLRRCSNSTMLAANAYQRHRAALGRLDPNGLWAARLKDLRDSDIRGINERALTEDEARARDTAAWLLQKIPNSTVQNEEDCSDDELVALPIRPTVPGETGDRYGAISWIWYNTPALNEQALTTSDPALVQSLRTQWVKTKIRAHHWRVQLLLVCEEMRRSLVFARSRAQHWTSLAENSSLEDSERLVEGKRAYALKHAAAYIGLHDKWAAKWYPLVRVARTTSFKEDIADLGVSATISSEPVVVDVSVDNDDEADNGDVVRTVCF